MYQLGFRNSNKMQRYYALHMQHDIWDGTSYIFPAVWSLFPSREPLCRCQCWGGIRGLISVEGSMEDLSADASCERQSPFAPHQNCP